MSVAISTLPMPVGPADHVVQQSVASADPGLVRTVLGAADVRPIARRSFFSDTQDKWLFLLCAVLGFAATYAVKYWLGRTGFITAAPALGMLAFYALVASYLPSYQLHPDRLGDNCYYMGFLFTLASLSAALVAIEQQNSAARGALIENLIGSFGIALFSTIGGITLRLVFMQGRREVEDVEQAVRTELQDAARLLKDQLGDAVQNLEGFRLRTQQVMDEQFRSVLEEFTAVSKSLAGHLSGSGDAHAASAERLAAGTDAAASSLIQAAKEIASGIKTFGRIQQQATEKLTGGSEKVVEEVERLVVRVGRIDVPTDLLTGQIEAARAQFGIIAGVLQEAAIKDAGRQAATERAAESLDRLLTRMHDLSAFRSIEESTERLTAGIDAASQAVQGASQALAAQVAALAAQAERDGAAISRARALAETDTVEASAALHRLQGSLAGVAESLVKQLGGA